ncbi:tetratricopeptide repeat protein [Nocardioides sp. Kera G14]|uniref:tetratricopeptide repeat protein n=1 Tax=Nocardioides sp. Kera G14 TaxID=2884264 RepID=UPI001D12662A|nr:tetratricopeptide repeat protein [Nocardioides sp. Kera G14]UDY25355.1 tetratricopeptide repeat protein [Nocardioides sp. Kera G14]
MKIPALVFPGQGPETAFRTAYDLLGRRAPSEALEVLEPALAEDPTNRGLRQLKAWALMTRVQLAKAEELLRELVAENPSDDWAQHALGRVLERQSRPAEALPHLKLAAIMSGDYDHEAAVYRVTRELARLNG